MRDITSLFVIYEVDIFKMSSKLSLVREERCFFFNSCSCWRIFLNVNIASISCQGPHNEPQRAVSCIFLLQNIDVTVSHILPRFNHLQGQSLFSLPEFSIVTMLRDGAFVVRIPAGADFLFSEASRPSLGPNQPLQ